MLSVVKCLEFELLWPFLQDRREFLHVAGPSGRVISLIGLDVMSEQGGSGINRNSKRNKDIRVQAFSERMIVSLNPISFREM